ncbi:MAG: LysM peptidoglycan-binding domain-containing protein [Treponema sp.]|jgi:nucleoid-associated protein YgaU|nr:LysM peptidoglycan-binding domain-containing protein [Treponema sp.]
MERSLVLITALIFLALPAFTQEEDTGEMRVIEPRVTTGQIETTQTDLEAPQGDSDARDEDESGLVQDAAAEPETAQDETPAESGTAQSQNGTEEIAQSILNNQYYRESIRLTEQAREAFEIGDYDASAAYAEGAAEQARLSDNYVAMRLADNILARAHSRYTWAGSVGAARRYPAEYAEAETAYNEAVTARKEEDWDTTTDASGRVLAALHNVKGAGGETGPRSEPPRPSQGSLPSQYTVRLWRSTKDCFWIIAGWSWVYGDSYQWRILYEANKDKLPDPANPNLIEPGMVLDIPSLKGEPRSGMWDPAAKY